MVSVLLLLLFFFTFLRGFSSEDLVQNLVQAAYFRYHNLLHILFDLSRSRMLMLGSMYQYKVVGKYKQVFKRPQWPSDTDPRLKSGPALFSNTHTETHTRTHIYTRARALVRTHIHTHARPRTHTHTHTHALTYTHIHTHTHTHTHTHLSLIHI